MHIVEAGQYRGVVFGVIVGVGIAFWAALELPIGDQGLEIGVHGAEVVVSGGHRGRVDVLALLGEQRLEPGAAAAE